MTISSAVGWLTRRPYGTKPPGTCLLHEENLRIATGRSVIVLRSTLVPGGEARDAPEPTAARRPRLAFHAVRQPAGRGARSCRSQRAAGQLQASRRHLRGAPQLRQPLRNLG